MPQYMVNAGILHQYKVDMHDVYENTNNKNGNFLHFHHNGLWL